MSKLPKTIKIGSIDYQVKVIKKLHDRDDQGRRIGLAGRIIWEDCEILLKKGMAAHRNQTVLMHEIVHGLLFNAGLDSEHDEQLVDLLAHGFVMVLRDNPDLVDYLVDRPAVDEASLLGAHTNSLYPPNLAYGAHTNSLYPPNLAYSVAQEEPS